MTDNIKPDADLSVVSAYFTIYAYHHLKEQLNQIKHLDFLFGEPTFLKAPLLNKVGNKGAVDTSALEKHMDEMVYALYDLTGEEIGVVEGKKG